MPPVPPALLLIAGALLVPFLPRLARGVLTVALPLLVLAYVVTFLPAGTSVEMPFMRDTLEVVRSDRLAILFAGIFCITGSIAALFAWHESDVKQQTTGLLYGAGALGVVFAGDLFTLYAFWELLAIAATVLVWCGGTPAAARAGTRYVLFHLFGGALLLAGIVLHASASGSIRFDAIDPGSATLGTWLILVGFALNAGVPPLHAWIPDAYPRATVAGSVFLAAFTTKAAVYALLRGFAGFEILVPAGVVMALWGVVYAVLASDLRTLLAYHIISQVGYMVAAAGIGGALAIDGAAAHAVNNLLYKGLLFMSVGAVAATTGRGNLADLGGLARKQPLVLALYLIGAASICGVPLTNGFLSKGMVMTAATEAHRGWTFLLLGLASVGTFVSVGLKLPYFVWFASPRDEMAARPAPPAMLAAMIAAAALCLLIGLFPDSLYRFLPHPTDYEAYTAVHVIEVVQLLTFAGFAFFLLLPNLSVVRKTLLDVDVAYRKAAPIARALLVGRVDALFDLVQRIADRIARSLAQAMRDPTTWFGEPRRGGAADFDPDRSRRPLLSPLLLTVATLVVIAVVLLSWPRPVPAPASQAPVVGAASPPPANR